MKIKSDDFQAPEGGRVNLEKWPPRIASIGWPVTRSITQGRRPEVGGGPIN
jgi:hypothetical protein